MKILRSVSTLMVAGSAALLCRDLRADPVAPQDSMQEAADRTREGIRHADHQEFEAALADFQRAFQLTQNPALLLNIAGMYEALDRPAEATDAFDRALANKSALPADKAARAVIEREAQASRTGQLDIVSNVPAEIEIDNVARDRTPLSSPLRVSAGTHIVGGVARGYAPLRMEVTVAARAVANVTLELVPMAGTAAHLWVRTRLPDAELFIDGKAMGQTPIPKSLAVLPGNHVVELKRPGYVPEKSQIQLDEGATGELTLEPKADRATLASDWGSLELVYSEPMATVAVDGGPPQANAQIELPRGKHHLILETTGFLPIERNVVVEQGQTTRVQVKFDPTVDTRTAYESRVSAHKTWGMALTIGGAAVAGLGAAFLVYNQGQKNSAEAAYNEQVALTQQGMSCDPALVSGNTGAMCQAALNSASADLDSARGRDVFGYVALGVGAASLGAGVYLLLTAGDAHRYEPSTGRTQPDRRASRTSWTLGVLPGGAVLSTRF